jgi:hypothetical protein
MIHLPEGVEPRLMVEDRTGEQAEMFGALPFQVTDVEGEMVCRCPSREIAEVIRDALNSLPTYKEATYEVSR